MREIEFRAKREKDNKWVYGFYGQFHNRPDINEPNSHQIFEVLEDEKTIRLFRTYIGGIWHIIQEHTLGQYTGLKDKNGTKIFEGDILSNNCCNRQCEFHIQGYVEFDKEWGYVVKMYSEDGGSPNWRFDAGDQLEVIGNIYDNPELLGGIRSENE